MKRGLLILALALLLGGAGFGLVSWRQHASAHSHGRNYARHGADADHPELNWLKDELGANDDQMERVRALHVAYHPEFEQLTRRLELSHRALATLTSQSDAIGAELDQALKDHAAVHLDCQRAMLKHFYETAACFSPDQARRYLDAMIPFVFQHHASEADGHSHK